MQIFKTLIVKREEFIPASIVTLAFTILHIVIDTHYFKAIAFRLHGCGNDFINAMSVSGFDAYTYSIITGWDIPYDIFRHPVINIILLPFFLLNKALIAMTGINCAQFIISTWLLLGVFYSFVFLYRILRTVVGVSHIDSILLSVMFFSFAYIMLSMVMPDHFGLTMPLLLWLLYVSGVLLKEKQKMTMPLTWLFFIPIAGITLSNGIKVFIASWFVNGKRFFHIRYLLGAVILPAALLWGIAMLGNGIRDDWNKTVYNKSDQILRQQLYRQIADTASSKDKESVDKLFKEEIRKRIRARYRLHHLYDHVVKKKKETISDTKFLNWTDLSTPRWASIVENFWGESLQLHKDYLLHDIQKDRPLIVHYKHIGNYIVLLWLALLFLGGVWCGRRSKFMWMCLAGMAFDCFLHLGIGFALDEVYIMAAHWAFCIPIAIAFLLKAKQQWLRMVTIASVVVLSIYLYVYNGLLLLSYIS